MWATASHTASASSSSIILPASYAFQSVAAALYARRDCEAGRFIDVSLMAATAGLMAPKLIEHQIQPGVQSVTNAPAGSYQTKDGWIAVTLIKEAHWVNICGCLEREELASDPRFADFGARRKTWTNCSR